MDGLLRGRRAATFGASWVALLLAVFGVALGLASEQTPPTVSSASISGAQLTIQFSESLTSNSTAVASDFTVNLGSAAQTVSTASVSSGGNVVLTLASAVPDVECTSDSVTVSYTATGSTLTGTGGTVAAFSNQAVTNSTDAAPAITSLTTDETGRYIYVTFCEQVSGSLDFWSHYQAFGVSVGGTTVEPNNVTLDAGTQSRIDLDLTKNKAVKEGQTVTVAYDKSKGNSNYPLKDLNQGGKLVESWSARTVTNVVDSPPSLVSVAALWDVITLTYSENLNEESVPDKSAFRISETPYKVKIESVAVSGKTVTLATDFVIRGNLSPKFQLYYEVPSNNPLQQADGKKDAPYFDGKQIASSTPTSEPVVQSAAVDGATLTITFDLPLKNVAKASAFAVGGVTGVSVSSTSFSGKVVTLTLSPAVSASDNVTISYTKPNAPPRVEARNIRDANTFTNQTVTNNTADPAPTFSSAAINAIGDTLTVTMSKNLLTTTAGTPGTGAFTISGGSAAITTVAVSGKTVTLTLSPKADEGDTITIAYTKPSSGGQLQSKTGAHLVASWTAESVTNGADGKPRPTSAALNGATLTITFDRALDTGSVPAGTDFTINGSTVTVSSVAVSGSTATLTLSAAVAHTDTVTVNYTKPNTGRLKRSGKSIYTDSFSTYAVTNNTPDPTPTFSSASVNAVGDTLTVTMSKNLLATDTGKPATSAFTLSGGSAAITTVAVSGKSVTLTLSPKADEGDTVTIAYTKPSSGGQLQSKTGAYLVASWTAQSVTNNVDGKPRPTSAAVNGTTLTINFDRALDAASKPGASTFTINGTSATASSVTISGSTATLTLSAAVAHTDTVTVNYTKPNTGRLKRSGKSIYTDSFSTYAVTNNTPDPTPTFSSASVNAVGDTLTVTMSKNLLATDTGKPATGAFTLSGSSAAITTVAVSGKSVTLTLSPKADEGDTVTIAYTKPSSGGQLQSATGGHLVASWTTQSVTNGADGKPRPTSAAVNGTMLTINFDRALDAASKPGASTFTINGSTATVSSVALSGSTATLTLSAAVAHTDVVTVTYTKPDSGGLKRSGKDIYVDLFSRYTVTNNTPDPTPTFSSAAVNAAGDTLTITMSKTLLTTTVGVPAKSAFTIAGGSAAVSAVSVNGKTVSLTLSPKADEGGTVTIAYTKPSSGGQLQSKTGAHLVASWTAQSVTNGADGKPRPTSAAVNGATLTINFDRALDAASKPGASTFTINGTSATASSLAISGSTVTLTLSAAVAHDAQVTVSYTKPNSGGLERSGKPIYADSFTGQKVMNNTPDPTPTFSSASVNAAGDTLTITMSKNLLTTTAGVPAKSAFELTGGSAAITTVAVNGKTVTLTLSPKADEGDAVTIAYTKPSSGGQLQSKTGAHLVASWTAQSVTNGADGKPRPTTAVVNITTLTITFDRALDTSSIPANTTFGIGGTSASVSSVAVSGSIATLTLSAAVAHTDVVTVGYTNPGTGGLKRSGKDIYVDTFTSQKVTNNTPAPPTLSSVIGDEQSITVTFSAALDEESVPSAAAFSLGASQPAVSTVAIAGVDLSLSLTTSLSEGGAYSLTYTVPGSAPLMSAQGVSLPAFSQTITNDTDVAPALKTAVGSGKTLVLTFDQSLDSNSTVAKADFTLTGDTSLSASTVSVTGDAILLTLSRDLIEDESASVKYTQPMADGIADSSGNRTETFTSTIDNQTDTIPSAASATVDGDTVTIVLDQAIYEDPRFDEDDKPPPGDFRFYDSCTDPALAMTVDSVEVANNDAGVGVIQLALTADVVEGDSFRITYQPTTNVKIVDHNNHSQRAEVTCHLLTNLTDTAPVVQSAAVDGITVTITFDQSLDPDSTPSPGAFSLSNDGPDVASLAISDAILTLTLASSVVEDAAHSLTYTPPESSGLSDPTDNLVAEFTESLTNNTDYAPFPKHIWTTEEKEHEFYLLFDQRLDPQVSAGKGWFRTNPELDIKNVSYVDVDGEERQLRLELDTSTPIREGVEYSLTYDPKDSEGLRDDDGDDGGNQVEGFEKAVDNRVDVAPQLEIVTIDRDSLTLKFDQALDPDHVPPPNCDWLETRELIEEGTCAAQPELYWFRVIDEAESDKTIDSVKIDGVYVELTLAEPVSPSEVIEVAYKPQSIKEERWNLQDVQADESSDANQVVAIDPTRAKNFTAAAPLSASVNRHLPTVFTITFDGDLSYRQMEVDFSVMEVTVNGKTVTISSAASTGATLTVTLADTVPECASVTFSYYASDGNWKDEQGHPILTVRNLPVHNLIDPAWGLKCVKSEIGSVILTFADDHIPGNDGWVLNVDDQNRDIDVKTDKGSNDVVLIPTPSVCRGDAIDISYTASGKEHSHSRTISPAAPCAVSAVADRTTMTVIFDQPLGNVFPISDHFTLTGTSAKIETVTGVDGAVLTLELSAPGIRVSENAQISFEQLVGEQDKPNMAPFTLGVTNDAAPPELESAIGFRSWISLQFDQQLFYREIATSRFIPLGPDLDDITVTSVEVSGASVLLELSEDLPDDVDLFALVYLAKERGGLESILGARVTDSVFIVENLTETEPLAESAAADGRTVTVTFDQQIDAKDASAGDFTVSAGHRTIEASALEWSRDVVVIELAERITSLDAVRLIYAPATTGSVRDLSGIALKPFELWVENRTPRPRTVQQKVDDAALRSSSGETTFERELVRAFTTDDGIRGVAEPGEGWTTFARRGLTLSVDASSIGDDPMRLHVQPLDQIASLMTHLEPVSPYCWDNAMTWGASAWWIGQTDLRGVPTDHRARVTVSGAEFDISPGSYCVLDLLSGRWRLARWPELFVGPSLVLQQSPLVNFGMLWPLLASLRLR